MYYMYLKQKWEMLLSVYCLMLLWPWCKVKVAECSMIKLNKYYHHTNFDINHVYVPEVPITIEVTCTHMHAVYCNIPQAYVWQDLEKNIRGRAMMGHATFYWGLYTRSGWLLICIRFLLGLNLNKYSKAPSVDIFHYVLQCPTFSG